MVSVTAYSGDGVLGDWQNWSSAPALPARTHTEDIHPIAELFKEVTGHDYSGTGIKYLIADDPYNWDMGYVPSIGTLTTGVEWLYELIEGCKPHPSSSPVQDYDAHINAGRTMTKSLEERLGHPVRFLELGAGTALNAMVASEMGMEAYAIELRLPLVAIAQQMLALGRKNGVLSPNAKISILHGNYFPKEVLATLGQGGGFLLENPYATEGKDVYDIIGLRLSEFQLIYNYPWPYQEGSPFFKQFMAHATKAPCVWQTPSKVKMIHDAQGPYFPKTNESFCHPLSSIREKERYLDTTDFGYWSS